MNTMDAHNTAVRLRKIADRLRSGEATLVNVERFKSDNSPLYMENYVEVRDSELGSVDLAWMERIAA